MLTDWVLTARLAHEIAARLRGARVVDAGMLPDGRFAVQLRTRNEGLRLLAIDVFGSPPCVTVETGDLGVSAEPGFARALASALRGTILIGAHGRRGDRLLRLQFGARSRFGVEDQLEVYAELVPRFGNVVLVKRGLVVAAAKEFSPAENPARAVLAGGTYALPPLPPNAAGPPKLVRERGDAAEFEAAIESGSAMRQPLYVYGGAGAIAAASVVPLHGYETAGLRRVDSVLELFAQLRLERVGRGERERAQRRRDALAGRLARRETRLRNELETLAEKRRRVAGRDALRAEGEAIYAGLHALAPELRDDAKERAAKLFAQYKKLGATLPHLDRREASVRAAIDAIEELRWETQRVADADLDGVEDAVAQLEGRRAPGTPAPARRKRRAPLESRTPSGSRIIVGRSPDENADVTFRIARPGDLWFHAQGIPGAHVVLARDDRTPAPEEDIAAAAALAAFYSRAKESLKVPVDYTQRKHVRKQQDAPPGLVWYTHAKTIVARPRPSSGES